MVAEQGKLTDAQRQLAADNWLLVPWVVGRIASKCRDRYEDELLSEGQLGLVKAARTYNPKVGKFTTWATLVIKCRLISFIRNQNRPTKKRTRVGDDTSHEALKLKSAREVKNPNDSREEWERVVRECRLDGEEIELLRLRFVDGLLIGEAAAAMGKNKNQVNKIYRMVKFRCREWKVVEVSNG